MPSHQTIETFQEGGLIWVVDWGVVSAILRTNANWYAIIHNGHTHTEQQSHWYNPFSYSMPDIVSYDIDWQAQRRQREHVFNQLMADATRTPEVQGCRWLRDVYLRQRISESESYRHTFNVRLNAASHRTMQNISDSVRSYNRDISIARGVRDTSTGVVLVGATVLSGGAALAAAGAGSVMHGGGTAEDMYYSTEHHYTSSQIVGAATIDTASTFIMTAIPIAQGADAASTAARSLSSRVAEQGVVVFLGANFDFCTGLIKGQTVEQAMTHAAVNAAGNIVLGRILDNDKVKGLINRVPLPAKMSISSEEANKFREGLVNNVASREGVGRIADAAADAMSPQQRQRAAATNSHTPHGECTVGEQACAELKALQLAIRPIGSAAP